MPRLRHYDFRHQCITTLLEIPEVSIETVQAVARHKIGDRTIEHYSAIRQEKKQQARDMLTTSQIRRVAQASTAGGRGKRAPLRLREFCRESKVIHRVTKKYFTEFLNRAKVSDIQGKF
jgi:hypothetical protein